MRTFGIIYLIVYLVDALVSVVGTAFPAAESVSNIVSLPGPALTIILTVLACLNVVRPRRVYLLASGFYVFMLGCGFPLAAAVMLRLGVHEAVRQISQRSVILVLHEQFPWYIFVHWALLAIWISLGFYCLRHVLLGQEDAEPDAAPNAGGAEAPPAGSSLLSVAGIRW